MTAIRSEIAVFTTATGALVVCGPKDMPLRSGQASVLLPADYNEETYEWSAAARAMIETPARVEAMLITRVKDEAEQRKMSLLSSGGAKKAEYAEKKAEVVEADRMVTGLVANVAQALLGLSTAKKQFVFVHATADALAHGDTEAAAIERFRAGILKSKTTASIAGVEAATCTAIRKATTAAGKRAAYAALKWP